MNLQEATNDKELAVAISQSLLSLSSTTLKTVQFFKVVWSLRFLGQ